VSILFLTDAQCERWADVAVFLNSKEFVDLVKRYEQEMGLRVLLPTVPPVYNSPAQGHQGVAMDNSKIYSALVEAFHEMHEQELSNLHNELCSGAVYIYSSLGDLLTENFTTPLQAVTAVLRGDVKGLNERYYWVDGMGDVYSANQLDDCESPFSYHDLANWVMNAGRESEFLEDEDEDYPDDANE